MASVLQQATHATTSTVNPSLLHAFNDPVLTPFHSIIAKDHVSDVQPVSRSLNAALTLNSWSSWMACETELQSCYNGTTSNPDLHAFLLSAVSKNDCFLDPSLDETNAPAIISPAHNASAVQSSSMLETMSPRASFSVKRTAASPQPSPSRLPSPFPPWDHSEQPSLARAVSHDYPASAPVSRYGSIHV
jgi:hypothetical protein